MYSNILVPVAFDDTHNPDAALEVARKLAEPDARITLLHVMEHVPPYAISYLPKGYDAELRQAVEQAMAARLPELGNATAEIREGQAAHEILDHAAKIGCDLIVVASHRPGFGDYLIGSTAARVVRHASCAVMVLR